MEPLNRRTAAADRRSPLRVAVRDSLHVGEARRQANSLGTAAGLDDTARGRLAIVVTESAANIVKHAGEGEIILALNGKPWAPGVQMLAIDAGRGIADVGAAERDGHSTAGTPGNGLGAMRRMSDVFDIWSTPGGGTTVFAEILDADSPAEVAHVGAAWTAHPAEPVCGDAWAWTALDDGGRTLLLVADGLGHGLLAAEASQAAVNVLREGKESGAAALLAAAHAMLRSTRGAAVAAIEIDPAKETVRFAGLGNISGVINGPRPQNMVSMNGTAGITLGPIREFTYACPRGSVVVVHSDGIKPRFQLSDYSGLSVHHPALVAAVLLRDFERRTDDATVVVVRTGEEGS
jgi:anti-sigma regulatory factor (Ser/Thr protein kinase)